MARILIIEDDERLRTTIREVLEHAAVYEVSDASDGEEGMRLYHEKPADLIITDMLMPKKDGFDVIMNLKIDYPDLKVIAISGGGRLDSKTYLEIAKGLGADCYLDKPFKLDELLEAVRDVLK